MDQNQKVIAIDAGNTRIKIGFFVGRDLIQIKSFNINELTDVIQQKTTEGYAHCILSSVLSEQDNAYILNLFPHAILFTHQTPLPIVLDYETPHTLGFDRICNAVALQYLNPNKNSVGIDIGTCIKFDVLNAQGHYLGGSISPGIDLRYKSLHHYTGKLPLLDDKIAYQLIGKSTKAAIVSGVIGGVRAELTQFMEQYNQQLSDLTIFMTGGDASYFEFPLKKNIFVDENLTLKGLYQIYTFNVK
jgi:type III pantothenate kinase